MYNKIIRLLLLTALFGTSMGEKLQPTSPSSTYEAQEAVYLSAPPKYNYNYEVDDSYKGLNFGQNEERDNSATLGEYHVQLPDGRLQVVKYAIKDAYSGYLAEVSYEGEAHYDPPSKYTTYKAVVPTLSEPVKAPTPKPSTLKPTPEPIVYKPLPGNSNNAPIPAPAAPSNTIIYKPLPSSGPSKAAPPAPVASNNIISSKPFPPPSSSSTSENSNTIVYKPLSQSGPEPIIYKPLPSTGSSKSSPPLPTSGKIYYKPLPSTSGKSSSPLIVNQGPSSPQQDFSESAPVPVSDSSSSSFPSYTPEPVVVVSSTTTPFVSTTPYLFSSSTNNYSS